MAEAGIFADPFTQHLRAPDVMERLASIKEVRKHMADPGFLEKMEELRKLAQDPALDGSDPLKVAAVGQQIAKAGHRDPRIMQAIMALMGEGLIVDEKDLKKAEDFGEMKRREPVQLEHLELVKGLVDPDEAKTKGNEYFKAGDFSAALAHYEQGVKLLQAQDSVPAAALATLWSNSALCLLKLRWPDRAKKQASLAIAAVRQAEDTTFDQSKLFYRRALACEQLRDFDFAVDDMARALQQAKKSNQSLAEQHRLKSEVERLKKLKQAAEEEAEKKRRERENERVAEVQRVQGAKLEKKESSTRGPPAGVSAEYLQEQDFSHWTQSQLREAVKGVRHTCQSGAVIEVLELLEQSKVAASVTAKRGSRALYYEMDLHVTWKGKAAKRLAPSEGPDEMQGLFRLYNVAHDTKFELGGDENTSYMYQLGWDQRLSGPWVEDLKAEAPELFDLLAAKVDAVIRELRKK